MARRMTLLEALVLVAAGLVAGVASAMAGGASVLTFPVLLAFGVPPLEANVTNTVGLAPVLVGSGLASVHELRAQRERVLALAIPTFLGALGGAVLLLSTPGDVFTALAPYLLGGACLLLLIPSRGVPHATRDTGWRRWAAWAGALVSGVYTGYFGAASGVLFLALVGLFTAATLHQLNVVKNVLVGSANAIAMVLFALFAPVVWPMAAALAVGALVGSAAGARLVLRVPARRLRIGVAVIGLAVAVRLAVG
ncbi:MAG: uncharacterized protein QOC64_2299 [Solirubrobacteraceae bacterium]|jgi:uncharacterized membrane protein YfcA|nr:uncharacterized protein [Solirubrobacteraceae bacterium]